MGTWETAKVNTPKLGIEFGDNLGALAQWKLPVLLLLYVHSPLQDNQTPQPLLWLSGTSLQSPHQAACMQG